MNRHIGRLLIATALGATLAFGWMAWRIWDTGAQDDHRPADAIVVLGAAQYDGRPSAILKARLDHAIELFGQGAAPWFVVTGGKAEGDRTTEAATARAYAIRKGVPAGAILFEDRGRTTRESLQGVGAVLHDHGLRSAIFVSDRTHMLRVLRIAEDQGIAARGSPTTTSPTDATLPNQLEATVRELGALALYFVGAEIR
ncbi:MAG TPA: YdcF family protein [Patescibacteria group bacterium]|nr:YdcF family protein [Patescibacteria group bacterium]